MISASCHCGNVRIELSARPEKLVRCNCSICRRNAALWAHLAIADVDVIADHDAMGRYIQGDKTLAVHFCRVCGCTTHWENLQPDGEHMAVNFRMCSPEVIDEFTIRQFDGADSWEFID